MPTWIETWNRLRHLTGRARFDDECDEEIRFHLLARAEDLERDGTPTAEAAAQARREFGSRIGARERSREAWRFQIVEDFATDLRFALRLLRRQPAFAAAVVLMLALGIGVNATVFAWLQTIVLDPLPGVSRPASLVAVVESEPGGTLLPLVSYPDFRDLAALADGPFSGVAGTRTTEAMLDLDGRNTWVAAGVATANLFDVLGVRAQAGRTFARDEDAGEGGHPVVVISDGLWRRQFGGDPAAIGRTVHLNRQAFTIVGILPPAFRGVSGGARVDIWAPLSMHDAVLRFGSYTGRTFRWIRPLARLRDDADLSRVRAALAVLSARLEASYPDSNTGVAFRAFRLWESPYGGQAAFLPVLRIVFAVAVGILLIVAANVSGLLLSRGARRETEVTIRAAIGAGRLRLIRQFLAESVALALMGGGAGLLIARWSVRALPRLVPAATVPFRYDFSLNAATVGFTVAVAIATSLLFGIVPALTASRRDLAASLNAGGRGSSATSRRTLGAFVVAEVALAAMLLVGAGLCVRGFLQARAIDLGFEPGGVLYASINLAPSGYTADRGRFFDRALRSRVLSLPGVTDAAFVNTPPLGPMSTFTGSIDVAGHEARASESNTIPFVIVSPGYFSAMRIPLLNGRDFEDADDGTRTSVAIVNETLARRYWPGLDPLGRQFRMAVGIAPSTAFTVVGVVRTSKYNSLAEPPTPVVYVAAEQRPLASLFMNLIVRSSGRPEPAIAALRREIHALDPTVEPLEAVPMTELIQPAFLDGRLAATMLAILAAGAVLLACGGLYAMMSYAVTQRTKEIGIRIALGAHPGDTVGMMVRHGMGLVAAGVIVGQIAALGSSRLLARFLYGVSATDAFTFAGTALLLSTIGLAACGVPALRAAGVDPVAAMRSE